MTANHKPIIAYHDLREWLAEADRLGEVRTVRNASWQEDVGLVAEAILRAESKALSECGDLISTLSADVAKLRRR